MSSGGQIVGAIGGAVAGFIISAGNPLGAIKGAAYGAAIGGYIDPPPGPNLRGPTLEDKSFQSAAYGVSIPRLYGTIATMGNIIYLENNEYKAVSKKESQGGKGGGGGTYETTTYFATFAVALAEAMPGSAIRRLWAGGKLIYSAGTDDLGTILQSQQNAAGWKYYDGTQTEPDSRMEGALGVGDCPSYEGTSYIIFYDFELTDYGNGLAGCPIKAEVCRYAENGSSELAPVLLYESFYPYAKTRVDPATGTPRVNNGYVSSVGSSGKYATFFTRYSVESASIVDAIDSEIFQHTAPGDWRRSLSEAYDPDDQKNQYIVTGVNDLRLAPYVFNELPIDVDPDDNGVPEYGRQYQAAHGAVAALGDGSNLNGLLMAGNSTDQAYSGVAVRGDADAYLFSDQTILRRKFGAVLVEIPNGFPSGTVYKIWYQEGYLFWLSPMSGGFSLRIYDGESLSLKKTYFYPEVDIGIDWQFTVYSGVLWIGMARHEFFASDRTEFVVKAWSIPFLSGRVNRYSEHVSTIVADLCNSAGLTTGDLNLTEIASETVDGYRCGTGGSLRADLGPLMVCSRFDLIEKGHMLYAKKRGASAVAEVPYAHMIGVAKRAFTDKNLLPSRYSISYMDYNREYDTSVQSGFYPSVKEGDRTESVPVVMTATAAAQLADILISAAHAESTKMDITLPQTYLNISCGDVINIEFAKGLMVQVRADSVTKNSEQAVIVFGSLTSQAVYISNAIGVEIEVPPENISAPSIVSPVMLDIPMLRPEMDVYGMVGAIYTGLQTQSFKGAVLHKSNDDGQTFFALARYSGLGTVAVVENIYDQDDCFVIDRNSNIAANILCGHFYSVSNTVMMTGYNYVAYGAPGRWEIMRYENATMVGDKECIFSTLLRGLHGTEWAARRHSPNDFIILLDDPDNQFLTLDVQALRATSKYRAVSVGSKVDDAEIYGYVYEGVNLKPLSPVNVSHSMDGDDIIFLWNVRTRFESLQWKTGVDAPLGENRLRFSVVITSGIGIPVREYLVDSAMFKYSVADQIADFGARPAVVSVAVTQISDRVGFGYAATYQAIIDRDPYVSLNRLLLHFNGVPESTDFIDDGQMHRAVEGVGDVRLMDGGMFGQCSTFDGFGDYLSVTNVDGIHFGESDFTVEFFINFSVIPYAGSDSTAYAAIFSHRAGINSNNQLSLWYGASERFYLSYSVDGASQINAYFANQTTVSAGIWYHIALSKTGGLLRLFINGKSNDEIPFNVSLFASSAPFIIGAANPGSPTYYLNGKLDEFRLKIGVGIYADDFAVPTHEFPNE